MLKELITYIAKSLVDQPDEVEVEEISGERTVMYELKVSKKDICNLIEPKTRIYYNNFYKCLNCNRIYWEGSHFEKMITFANKIINNS